MGSDRCHEEKGESPKEKVGEKVGIPLIFFLCESLECYRVKHICVSQTNLYCYLVYGIGYW